MASASPARYVREQPIADALEGIDPTSLDLWDDLDALSTHTRVEQVEVPVEGIILGPGNRFSAVLNLYVVLQYGNDRDEGFTTSDSFLAKVSGRIDGDIPTIETSSVDTSAFYE